MAAKDALNMELFHGTGGAIEGGVVKPGKKHSYGYGAYATNSLSLARRYATKKAREQGRLFGTVYKVHTLSEPDQLNIEHDWTVSYVADPKGLEVVEAVDYPINTDAVYKPRNGI